MSDNVNINKGNNVQISIHTGWMPVERGETIDFDLENFSLYLKTDSLVGSDEKVEVYFSASASTSGAARGFKIYFTSSPFFYLYNCMVDSDLNFVERMEFSTALPSAVEKIWRISLSKTSGYQLIIECNKVEVLNMLLSNCNHPSASDIYRSDSKFTGIFFPPPDTASDFYSTDPYTPVTGKFNLH